MKVRNILRATSVLAALSISAVALVGCSAEPSTPEDIVKSYLEAVRDGNADRAVELINPGVEKAERILLTSDALEDAGEIENIIVLSSADAGYEGEGMAEVTHREVIAKYDLDGKTVEATFTADKTSDGWTVAGGYEALYAPGSSYATEFVINGVPVTEEPAQHRKLTVFPGVYTIEFPGNDIVTMEPAVYSTASPEPVYDFQITDKAQRSLDDHVTAFITDCFEAGPDDRDHSCPNWVYTERDSVGDVKWNLDTAPEYDLIWGDGPIITEVKTPLAASISYTYMDNGWFNGGIKSATEQASTNWSFSVEVKDGTLSFSKSDSERVASTYGEVNELAFY